MRTSHTLAITALLLALAAGRVVGQDSRAAVGAATINLTTVPTNDDSRIPRSAAPLTPYDWNASEAERRAMEWPAEQPAVQHTILTVFIPVLFMIGVSIFSLVFACRSMRAQMRRERIHYRPRGPAGPPPQSSRPAA